MLIDAVRLSGWVPGLNALKFSDDYEVDLPSTDCDDGEGHFETALISVATLFTVQRLADAYNSLWKAASFNAYGVFCAEHPGAIEIVKNLQQLVTASLAHADSPPERSNDEEEEADQYPDGDSDGKDPELSHAQRQSMTPLDNQPSWHSRSNHDLTSMPPSQLGTKKAFQSVIHVCECNSQIISLDLFNRYPLLRAPLILNRGPTAPTGTDAVVTDAKKAMVDVAALINSANFSHLQQQQTSCIGACLPASATVLTFIRTLRPCTLAGSLDVVRVPALKAKYLAAFLYEGGFLALANVIRGPWYELRYWFSLEGFELYDTADDDPLLPYSFHLYNQVHEFEITAYEVTCLGDGSAPGWSALW
ncbi:hypothetical protein BGW80DRAFT_1253965 [Lactifluus volemus]|nr:hypothetical protein BGW80DRAFT_1253965 [Lactifluus volemus]